VRSGWVNVEPNAVANGLTPRLTRLSRNGTTDVVQERTWLDGVVRSFVDPGRFPVDYMPMITAAVTPDNQVNPSETRQQLPEQQLSNGVVAPNGVNQNNVTNRNGGETSSNQRVGVVGPRMALSPLIQQIERMQTE
jgi:hypothetical protein